MSRPNFRMAGAPGWRILLLTVLLTAGFMQCANRESRPPVSARITTGDLQHDVRYLASDELQGRRIGTPGATRAAAFIVEALKAAKIPAGSQGRYYQTFDYVAGVEPGPGNAFRLQFGDSVRTFTMEQDFRPLGLSSSGEVTGPLAFAGYGITADSLGYDDYAGLNVEDKIVLILSFGPEGDNPHGEFGSYLSLRYKASNALRHGAAGLIVIPGPEPYPEDRLIRLQYDQAGDAGIPALSAKRAPFEPLFARQADSLREIQAQLNLHKVGGGILFRNVQARMRTDLHYMHKNGENVIGVLAGTAPGARDSAIVLGAHYDHLGLGGQGSLAPGTRAIHNGADDNASGTAALLELAGYFAGTPPPRHTIIFAAFSGEEEGLLGSRHYVEHPPFPLDRTLAMLNMDMIGRPVDSTLIVGGTNSTLVWDSLLTRANRQFHWELQTTMQGYESSDHVSFYSRDIPVLFFFTGVHRDYHRPSDDWDKLEYPEYTGIVRYIAAVVRSLDSLGGPLPFTASEQPVRRALEYRVSLHIIPDYAATIQGLRITEVLPGGPAEEAGLQSGDVIVHFGNREINNIYDYTYALQDFVPGEVVDLIVVRNGERRRFTVSLESAR